MIIKEPEYCKCEACGYRHQIADSQLGCDICEKPINRDCFGGEVLEITIFPEDIENRTDMHFCSWRCVFKALPNLSTEYFISLPSVTVGRLDEFKDALKELQGGG